MNDDLDNKTDAELNAAFAVEVAGLEQRTEGLLWDASANRAFILEGSELATVRRKMGLPMGTGILVSYCTDANAALPWLEKHTNIVPVWADGSWSVDVNVERQDGEDYSIDTIATADAPEFARAACIALIRAKRAQKL